MEFRFGKCSIGSIRTLEYNPPTIVANKKLMTIVSVRKSVHDIKEGPFSIENAIFADIFSFDPTRKEGVIFFPHITQKK